MKKSVIPAYGDTIHSLVDLSLYDFIKEGWSVSHWFGEYLKQISVLIPVHENVKFLQFLNVLVYVSHMFGKRIVVLGRSIEKFNTPLLQISDRFYDVISLQRNMRNM